MFRAVSLEMNKDFQQLKFDEESSSITFKILIAFFFSIFSLAHLFSLYLPLLDSYNVLLVLYSYKLSILMFSWR